MTEQQIKRLEEIWSSYKNDSAYNDIGKLNLVAVLGENAGLMLEEIRALKATIAAQQQRAADVACVCGCTEFYNDKMLGFVCCHCQAPHR